MTMVVNYDIILDMSEKIIKKNHKEIHTISLDKNTTSFFLIKKNIQSLLQEAFSSHKNLRALITAGLLICAVHTGDGFKKSVFHLPKRQIEKIEPIGKSFLPNIKSPILHKKELDSLVISLFYKNDEGKETIQTTPVDSTTRTENLSKEIIKKYLHTYPNEQNESVVKNDEIFIPFKNEVGWKERKHNTLGKEWKDMNARWDSPIERLSPEEYQSIDVYLGKHTLRSPILATKPIMDTVNYIALHSTATTKPDVIEYLQKTGKVHYIVLEDGSIRQYLAPGRSKLSQQNHLGKGDDPYSCAIRMGDDQVTFETIGIEVVAGPSEKRNEKQYQTVKKLISYLGEKYNLLQRDILTHTMVAYSPKGLMRKNDPYSVDWEKLQLQNPGDQINMDVVSGKIAPNLLWIYKWARKRHIGSDAGPELSHEKAIQYMKKNYRGVDRAIRLNKKLFGGKINTYGHLADQPDKRLTIDEVDILMKSESSNINTQKTHVVKNDKIQSKKYKKKISHKMIKHPTQKSTYKKSLKNK